MSMQLQDKIACVFRAKNTPSVDLFSNIFFGK